MKNNYNKIAGKDTGRLIAISDAVFGVAMTLLVLEIKVPEIEGNDKELIAAFVKLMPKFLVYFLSFMTAGIFWMGQSAQFEHIRKSDRNLSWITLLFLLFVSVLPFTTAFLGDYISHPFAIGIYWLNIFLLGLILYISWNYAEKNGFIDEDAQQNISGAIRRRIIVSQSLYLIGALSGFLNPYLGIGVIIAIQLNYAFAFFNRKGK
jgi:uncharacterized membrane protein